MAKPLSMTKRCSAEFVGTFWLVFGGCGSAVLSAAFPNVGIGLLGVSLAFGLTVLTMAYAIGHISGCHLNPAVSIGLVAGKRFPASELPGYIVAQVAGGIAGAAVLYGIASGKAGFDLSAGFGRDPLDQRIVACRGRPRSVARGSRTGPRGHRRAGTLPAVSAARVRPQVVEKILMNANPHTPVDEEERQHRHA